MTRTLYFLGSFAAILLICLVGWWLAPLEPDSFENSTASLASLTLLDSKMPITELVSAASGEPVADANSMWSDAVVILLGGMGCSWDQVSILKHWGANYDPQEDTERLVIALFADPLLGGNRSRYESTILRRISGVEIPMLVYVGEEFGPRLLGVRTPQVVRVSHGRISKILEPGAN